MLDFIFSLARGCLLFYIMTNLYLVIDYLVIAKGDIDLLEVFWRLFLGFVIAITAGIEAMDYEWK